MYTNEENYPNYYAIIPAKIRYDKQLSANEKLLYGEITALSNKEGMCWAQDKYFAKLYNVSDRSVRSWIKNLKDCGYLNIWYEYKPNSKEIAKRYMQIIDMYKPMEENFQAYGRKLPQGMEENMQLGMEENFLDNNINTNTININSNFSTQAEENENTKSVKALTSYINSLPYNKALKIDLLKWYDSVKGKVSIQQLKEKLNKIEKETKGNQKQIQASINQALDRGWKAFYWNKSNLTSTDHLLLNKNNPHTFATIDSSEPGIYF